MHATSCRLLALAKGVHLETDTFEHIVNENVTTLKEEGWHHQLLPAHCRRKRIRPVHLHVMALDLATASSFFTFGM